MKVLALILSLYILALNFVPCGDSANSFNSGTKAELSQTADHDHQHSEGDFCSPFCQCNCCNHVQIVQFHIQYNNCPNTINISTQDTFYACGVEKQFSTTLLQPPQV
ncbi:MAG: DUF6660 family protein [Flavobacteriaceae bacterium]